MKELRDFYLKWAMEEGLTIPDGIAVDMNLNAPIFRINSEKFLTAKILKAFKIPRIECFSLTMNASFALAECGRLFEELRGSVVVRGNKGTCGLATFFPKTAEEAKEAVSSLLKQGVLPLISPYYEARYEYRAYWLGSKVELVVRKEKNPATNKHNLSSGAKAFAETDPGKLARIEAATKPVAELFQLGFAGVDLLDTEEGLKVVELSIPNFKRFSMQSADCERLGKELFLKALKLANL